jgi:hypothetical protein
MFRFFALIFLIVIPEMLLANENPFSYRLNWYNRARYWEETKSFANPQKKNPEIDAWTYETDLRTSFSWEKGTNLFKLDPRLLAVAPDRKDDQVLFLNEAYYQSTKDDHQITIGLQNYQWGPAEMFSPTNPIFRFLSDQRSLFFLQRGRNLVRWNWTLSNSWNLVTMVEVSKNGVDLPREHQHFAPNGLLKIERSFEKSDNYIGLVGGITPMQEPFVGEYGAYSLSDETSVYLDVRHQYQTHNFYPGENPSDPYLQKFKDSDQVFHLGTVGIRHEARVDFRLEYIYNGLGLDRSDWKKAQASLQTLSPLLPQNFKSFIFSGRDVNQQHYGYASVRIPDLGDKNSYTVFLRHFRSLQDQSSYTQIQMDRETGESFNIYAEAAANQGHQNEDFTLFILSEISLGFRWSL